VISSASRPRLATKARLRFDRQAQQDLLLYPEKGLALNPTAAAILKLCTGEHTVDTIVDHLAAAAGAEPRERIERDVVAFLRLMVDRGLVREGP
jgi:coenzyme PQQ biosynthesis protein PqqD